MASTSVTVPLTVVVCLIATCPARVRCGHRDGPFRLDTTKANKNFNKYWGGAAFRSESPSPRSDPPVGQSPLRKSGGGPTAFTRSKSPVIHLTGSHDTSTGRASPVDPYLFAPKPLHGMVSTSFDSSGEGGDFGRFSPFEAMRGRGTPSPLSSYLTSPKAELHSPRGNRPRNSPFTLPPRGQSPTANNNNINVPDDPADPAAYRPSPLRRGQAPQVQSQAPFAIRNKIQGAPRARPSASPREGVKGKKSRDKRRGDPPPGFGSSAPGSGFAAMDPAEPADLANPEPPVFLPPSPTIEEPESNNRPTAPDGGYVKETPELTPVHAEGPHVPGELGFAVMSTPPQQPASPHRPTQNSQRPTKRPRAGRKIQHHGRPASQHGPSGTGPTQQQVKKGNQDELEDVMAFLAHEHESRRGPSKY